MGGPELHGLPCLPGAPYHYVNRPFDTNTDDWVLITTLPNNFYFFFVINVSVFLGMVMCTYEVETNEK